MWPQRFDNAAIFHGLVKGTVRRNCSKKLNTKVRWSSGGFVAGASTNRSPSGCRSNMRIGPRRCMSARRPRRSARGVEI